MAYTLKSITLRTDNSTEGIAKIENLWKDIANAKLPILFDSEGQFQPGISPISIYSNYEDETRGMYDLTIEGVHADFFAEMEQKVAAGKYVKFDVADDDLGVATKLAWQKVWTGNLNRAFTQDYESTVPGEYTPDGKAHCYLYIAIKK